MSRLCTSDTTKNNPGLDKFLAKYRHNRVPVHIWGKKRHSGEKGKPETGQVHAGAFIYV